MKIDPARMPGRWMFINLLVSLARDVLAEAVFVYQASEDSKSHSRLLFLIALCLLIVVIIFEKKKVRVRSVKIAQSPLKVVTNSWHRNCWALVTYWL